MFTYRKATMEDLEKIWNKDIKNNPNEECWVRWKELYINYNKNGEATSLLF